MNAFLVMWAVGATVGFLAAVVVGATWSRRAWDRGYSLGLLHAERVMVQESRLRGGDLAKAIGRIRKVRAEEGVLP